MDEQIIKTATRAAKTSHMRSGKSEGGVFEAWDRRCIEKNNITKKKRKQLLMPRVQINSSEKKAAQD